MFSEWLIFLLILVPSVIAILIASRVRITVLAFVVGWGLTPIICILFQLGLKILGTQDDSDAINPVIPFLGIFTGIISGMIAAIVSEYRRDRYTEGEK